MRYQNGKRATEESGLTVFIQNCKIERNGDDSEKVAIALDSAFSVDLYLP